MDKFLSSVKNTKILGIVGAVLLVLGNFFAFYTISLWGFKESISLFSVWEGKLIFLLGIVALIVIFNDFVMSKIPEGKATFLKSLNNQKFVAVIGAVSGVLLLISSSSDTYGLVKLSLGFYLLLVGVILTIAYPFVYKENK